MALFERSTLPNAITVARIVLTPAVYVLVFIPTFTARFIAFLVFLTAAFSDLWDGYLARKHGWISNFGKLLDPIADKLLLVATFVPFYIVSRRDTPDAPLPLFGELPLWIMIVIFGREVLITGIRSYAARGGVVIAAGKSGKLKAVFQNIFIGTTIFWYALQSAAHDHGWTGMLWERWQIFHGTVFLLTLAIALWLTVYSLGIYLYEWRRLLSAAATPP
ncbi:MAG: CDP-diacylglycerol--glycerol-3-phosphate 3-phosphatidyltransferase [Longimicrobiales bacterium]